VRSLSYPVSVDKSSFRAVRSYAVGSVGYNGFSSRTSTTFPSSGRKRHGFLQPTAPLPFAISSIPLILKARSCGHSPRKHNLKSHLAAHANPASKLRSPFGIVYRRPGHAALFKGACQSCGSTGLNLNLGRNWSYVRSAVRLAFCSPFMKEPPSRTPL
jgi:hypothetical protein